MSDPLSAAGRLAVRVADVVQGSPATTTLITIDGPAGAGKTSLADDLWVALARLDLGVEIVHMDDLYDGWDGLDERLSTNLRAWIVLAIRDGLHVQHPVYDWHAGRFTHWREVPSSRVLVLEGVGAGQPVTSEIAGLRVWVEAPPDICRTRAFARDPDSTPGHWDRWVERQEQHFAMSGARSRADVIVTTT